MDRPTPAFRPAPRPGRAARALPFLGALLAACAPPAPPPAAVPIPVHFVEDVDGARLQLEEERGRARAPVGSPAERLRGLTRLGLWAEADSMANGAVAPGPEFQAAAAELRLRQHRYRDARDLVDLALVSEPGNRAARLARARLQMQAWELPAASATLEGLLAEEADDADATVLLGRVRLLEKRYDEALRLALEARGRDSLHVGSHLLEAEVHFWNRELAGAETALVRALEADPFDPDARFAFGYALWRRQDAALLDEMMEQWSFVLEVDPLHYRTHWHLGNGYTDRTYADYATPAEPAVRERLAPADSLLARGRTREAVALAREVEAEYPDSPLPPMLRASAFYLAREMERGERLDSAEAGFREILAWKRSYGPAHNGLAAVIDERQAEVLAAYDSLEARIAGTPTPPDSAFAAVFPDVRRYPGDRVEKMARQQLSVAMGYLPLVARQGRRFRIPPLHQDLAAAMGDPWFRLGVTFDNRRWMDIRGVGSGAAGIEYLERGSHRERNVLLHEFVHLVHEIVLTDAEDRRARDLYHRALAEGRTLDYYAASNESEFLAQAYAAFLSPVLVHPLDHKSMATREDLRAKDPATFAFVDSLATRAEAALAGYPEALAANWAQVYVNLAARAGAAAGDPERWATAAALLDSALVRDSTYLPAILAYAAVERERGRLDEAEGWISRAEGLDPLYAPVQAARAALVGARARGNATFAVEERAMLLRRALELEDDLAGRAALYRELRELLLAHGWLPEAIRVAEEYEAEAPAVSTYLRDRRDEAALFVRVARAGFGYGTEALDFLRDRVARAPHDPALRAHLADALLGAGLTEQALAALEDGQRLHLAAGAVDAGLAARIAEIRMLLGDARAAREAVQPFLAPDTLVLRGDLRLARVLQSLDQSTEANRRLGAFPRDESPRARAEFEYTRGWIDEWRGDVEMAEAAYRSALAADPYHRAARVRLVALLRALGRDDAAAAVVADAESLALPPGPDLVAELERAGS